VHAAKLHGKLLLAVGAMDKNVDPSSTMQVASALIEADKDFELYVDPRGGHGVLGSGHGQRRLWDFFVRHLAGQVPRHSSAAKDPAAKDAA
jgi:dipeptidyl aminopeptidase/acylaminoacyl peptidase